MQKMLELLERERPDNVSLIPRGKHELTKMYVEYMQLLKQLEECYDQLCHPQKREDTYASLEAATGRALEVRSKVVQMHGNNDFFPLADPLRELGLTPDALEVPIPRCLRDDRSKLLEDRQTFFDSIIHKYGLEDPSKAPQRASHTHSPADTRPPSHHVHHQTSSGAPADAAAIAFDSTVGSSTRAADKQQQPKQEVHRSGLGTSQRLEEFEEPRVTNITAGGGRSLAPLEEELALQVIQRNERGRQGRQRARLMSRIKIRTAAQDEAVKRIKADHEIAATTIQAMWRGYTTRRHEWRKAEQELAFLGMKAPNKEHDPQSTELSNLARRKTLQQENYSLYEQQLVNAKKRVYEQEAQSMRETIQDKINAWFVENRDPETGDYPDFPAGGSREILDPPPLLEELPESEEQQRSKQQLQQQQKKPGKENGNSEAAADSGTNEDPPPSNFLEKAESALNEWASVWKNRHESTSDALKQRADTELIRQAVRPVVFEEVRQEVDDVMRTLLQNLKDMVEAERATKLGKKPKKSKSAGRKRKGGTTKGKGRKKGKKDPTAHHSMEELYVELVQEGIVKNTPRVLMSDYSGGWPLLSPSQSCDPEPVRVRQTLIETAVLPHLSEWVHWSLAPSEHVKSILLYGHSGTGKTLLALAVAFGLGANVIDLSPRNTDGKYAGGARQAQELCHKGFKVAKMMAPSVILVDEAEKIFLTGKRSRDACASLQEQPNRVKKALKKELKQLKGGERVVLLGISREPYIAQKKNEKALYDFFNKFVHVPLPRYADRRALFPQLFERFGVSLPDEFDLSTLVHLSEGYTPADIEQAVRHVLTPRRMETVAKNPIDAAEVAAQLCKTSPVSKEADTALRAWEQRIADRRSGKEKSASAPKQAKSASRRGR